MKRRDLLRLGAALPLAIATRGIRAQTGAITRAAVVIGVDRPSKLPPLNAAASGATSIASWLAAEGFEVKLFTDEEKPVAAADIFAAVDGLVNLGTLQQLVVYFAGHGCAVGTGEYWLLSQALHNPNEAVSISQCYERSRLCGIPNVIFISDACRSTSASLGIQELHGYVIFPTINNTKVDTSLDRFLATRIGAPAYEVKDAAGKYSGIYTECLLDAYSDPDDSMTEKVNGVRVVPNRKLAKYLLSEVPKRAQISDVLEYPDSQVTSEGYIGRVETHETITELPSHHYHWDSRHGRCACGGCGGGHGYSTHRPPRPTIGDIPLTIKDLPEFELSRAGLKLVQGAAPTNLSSKALQPIAAKTGFAATRAAIASAQGPTAFKYATGINVFGTRLRRVVGSQAEAGILHQGNGSKEPAVVDVNTGGRRQANLALEFEDGSGTVIAALQNFVARVVVDRGAVISISYAPAHLGEQPDTPGTNDRRNQLQAVVATAAKFGVFRIDGPPDVRNRNAKQLANAIRADGSIDPTLAIYGAYAYADAGLHEQVRALHEIMKTQLGTSLFDIAMLAGALAAGEPVEAQAPFCPMLSQGWQFLAVKGVRLPEKLASAQNHVVPALWTTFDGNGMSIVESLL